MQGNQLLQEMASLARAGGLGLSVVATSSHSAIRRGFGTVSGASGPPNVRFTGAGEEEAADKPNEEDDLLPCRLPVQLRAVVWQEAS